MTEKEMIAATISLYVNLQRIKVAPDRDKEIDLQLREARAKLETFGVNLENLMVE